MKINITYDISAANAPDALKSAVAAAVAFFESRSDDTATINITLGWGNLAGEQLPDGALGVSTPAYGIALSYNEVRNALWQDAVTSDAFSAALSLALADPTHGGEFYMNSAEAKILGLVNPNSVEMDGYIGLDCLAAYTFDPSQPVAAGTYDLVSIIEHEISHILGRTSLMGEPAGDGTSLYSTLDLFRYTASGTRAPGSANSFFSVDGIHLLLPFNNPANGGTSSDWSDTIHGDLFDAFGDPGIRPVFSATDKSVLDVLGWHARNTLPSYTPPATTSTSTINVASDTSIPQGQMASFNVSGLSRGYYLIKDYNPPYRHTFTNSGRIVSSGTQPQTLCTEGYWDITNTVTGEIISNDLSGSLSRDLVWAVGMGGFSLANAGLIQTVSRGCGDGVRGVIGFHNASTGIVRVSANLAGAGVICGGGEFDNAGLIEVTASIGENPAYDYLMPYWRAVGVTGATSFTNTGTIRVSAGDSRPAVAVEIVYTASYQSGTVYTNAGSIISTDFAFYVERGSRTDGTGAPFDPDVTIENSGLIVGDLAFANGRNHIHNTGRLAGDIYFGDSDSVYDGGGTLNGSIFLGYANNTITLGAGGVAVYGGGCHDTITGGSGDDFFDIARGNNQIDGADGINTLCLASAAMGYTVDLRSSAPAGLRKASGAQFASSYGQDTPAGRLGRYWGGGPAVADPGALLDASASQGSLVSPAAGTATGAGVTTVTNIQRVIGTNFNDTLIAGTSAVYFDGGSGQDTLTGGLGGDTLVSGDGGGDMFTGGAGGDTFVYCAGSATLTVNDFNASADVLKIFGHGVADAVTQQGADTLIALSGGDCVLLKNTQASSLTASNVTYSSDPYFNPVQPGSMPQFGTREIAFSYALEIGAGERVNMDFVGNDPSSPEGILGFDLYGSYDPYRGYLHTQPSLVNHGAIHISAQRGGLTGFLMEDVGDTGLVNAAGAEIEVIALNGSSCGMSGLAVSTNEGTFRVSATDYACYANSAQSIRDIRNAQTGVIEVTSSEDRAFGFIIDRGSISSYVPKIVNEGTITISGATEAYGLDLRDDAYILFENTATGHLTVSSTGVAYGVKYDATPWFLTNAGTIEATGASAIGFQAPSEFTNSGYIRVTSTDPGTPSIGVYYTYSTNSVLTNSGTIIADQAVLVPLKAGDLPGNGVTVHNSGLIVGDIILATIDNQVDNTGTITGNIHFSAGKSSYSGASGHLNGAIYLGSGNDTVTTGTDGGTIYGGGLSASLQWQGGLDAITGGTGGITRINYDLTAQQATLSQNADNSWNVNVGSTVIARLVNVQSVSFNGDLTAMCVKTSITGSASGGSDQFDPALLTALNSASVSVKTVTEFKLTMAGGDTFDVTGSGFSYTGNSPSGGTISSIVMVRGGVATTLSWTGTSLLLADAWQAITGNNVADFNGLLLRGDISFQSQSAGAASLFSGSAGFDQFDLQIASGADVLSGGAGDDVFRFANGFAAGERVDGGDGNDTLRLNGDYAGVAMNAQTLTNVEQILLAAGHDYALATNDTTVAVGKRLKVDATCLGAGDDLTFDGSAETDGSFDISGGAGHKVLIGGAGNDTFRLTSFAASDSIDGGSGNDRLFVNGDFSAGVVFGASTVRNLETITFGEGYSYKLTLTDANLAAGQTLTVDGSSIESGATYKPIADCKTLTFDGSAETDGSFHVVGSWGSDTINTGAGNDVIDVGFSYRDVVSAGAGDDTIIIDAPFLSEESIDGGAGYDTVLLRCKTDSACDGALRDPTKFKNVEKIVLGAGTSYDFSSVNNSTSMTIDGSALTDTYFRFYPVTGFFGSYVLIGGGGNDQLAGGEGNDTIMGGAGNDKIYGAGGDDVIFLGTGSDTYRAEYFSTNAFRGNDTVYAGADFDSNDVIDGGDNAYTTLVLEGDYAKGVVFKSTNVATSVKNVDTILVVDGYSYNFTSVDESIEAGNVMAVDASALGGAFSLVFNGSAELDGRFVMTGGAGADSIVGGACGDTMTGGLGNDFIAARGGNDSVSGGGGDDILDGGAGNDALDGGTGSDTARYITATSGVTVSLTIATAQAVGGGMGTDTLTSIENLTGSTYADTLVGDGGNNILTGGAGADTLRPGMGSDTIYAGDGNDTISFTGGRFDAADMIDGGAGNDLLWLTGDYSGGVVMNATTLTNVESIAVAAGFNYSLTTADTTVGAGQQLSVDTTSMGASNSLYFDGSAETNGSFTLLTGAGADTLIGGGSGDTFRAGGGFDHVSGNGGNDSISFSLGHLDAADVIDGGTGTDLVWLNTDYTGANAVTFNATTLANVETIALSASYSFSLTTADATVGAGRQLTVDGSGLGAAKTLSFNGSAETDGSFLVIGGAGGDTIIGGAGNDTLSGRAGNDTLRAGLGNDVAFGGDGDDTISFTNGKLNASDIVDGGAGWDTVWLNGDYTGANAVNFFASTMANVESIGFAAGFNYTLKSSDGTVASGKMLTLDASTLGASNALSFDGSAETNGAFTFVSGSGGDVFTGGSGADTFKYDGAGRSTGLHYDTINALNFANDSFDIPGGVGVVTGIDAAKTTGALSTASFDTDLATALSALGAHHAILFTPNAGSMSGQTFLVVDCNGTAGYQSGQDLVIRLNGYSGALAAGAFQ